MAKTGSTNNYYSLIDNLERNQAILDKSKEYSNRNLAYKMLATEQAEINKSRNILNIINCERGILKYELSLFDNIPLNKGRITSLESAVNDLDKAADLIKSLNNDPKSYKIKTDELISLHQVDRNKDGIPRDLVHRFLDSHTTRLNNSLINSNSSFYERSYIKERLNGVKIVKNDYIKLQSKALDIKLPEKKREIER